MHWAHRVRHRFPDGQLYINLRGFDPAHPPTAPGDAVRRFLDALGVPSRSVPADREAQIDLYRSLVAGKRILVVLDNARDADQVRPLLPGAPDCLVLVTSRNRLTGLVAIDGAHPLPLDLLTPDEARHLLTARLGEHRITAEPDAVDELITWCARLPLALAIAAARAATNPRLPLADLAAELRHTHRRLDALTGDDTATGIRAVFACSYRTLSREAARLFRYLGLHPGPDCSTTAAASLAGIPPDQVTPLLAELTRAHLITEPTPGRYTLHDLLRAYAAERTHAHDPDDDRHAAIHRLFDHYLYTAYDATLLLNPHRDPIILAPARPGVTLTDLTDAHQALAWFTTEHPVLLAAIRQAVDTGSDIHTWQLAWTLTTFLDLQVHWQDWATTHEAALAAARRLADCSAEAVIHQLLAGVRLRLDRHGDAYAHLQHALDLFGKVGDHAGRARTHLVIARVCEQQGRHREALHHAQQALNLYQTLGRDSGQATALNMIGYCHNLLGEYQQALANCQQALALFEDLGHHQDVANTWDSLGEVHHRLGDYRHAAACYQHAVALFLDLGDRYDTARTLTNLGDTHHASGNRGAARDAWQQALTILDELNHPDAEPVRSKLHAADRRTTAQI